MTQLHVPNRQTTPTPHTRVRGSSFRCLDKEDKRPQRGGRQVGLDTQVQLRESVGGKLAGMEADGTPDRRLRANRKTH
eukprot:scaffold77299_cov52-Phaeocystis_antarctica.AAC.1